MKKTPVILLLLIGILGSCGQGGSPVHPDASSAASETSNTQNVSDISVEKNESASHTSKTGKYGDSSRPEIELSNKIVSQKSEKSINDLITVSYPEKDLIEFFNYQCSDNFKTQLHKANEKFPVECIREPKDSAVYCVYKTQEGGLYYVFYYGDTLRFANYAFYSKKSLTRKDFKSLKKGMNRSAVEEIDEGYKIINSIKPASNRISLHLVQGGFMKITYTSKSGESRTATDLQIESINFIPNGREISEDIPYEQDFTILFENNFTVLEQDYFK